jgi:hypothetical protein
VGFRAGWPAVDSRQGQSIHTCSGSDPFSYPMETGGHFPELKRKGCEADHLLPSNAEVKICGALLPLHVRPYGVVLN